MALSPPRHAAIALTVLSLCALARGAFIPADDTRLSYTGRWDSSSTSGVALGAWPNVMFHATVSGATYIDAEFTSPESGARVIVLVNGATAPAASVNVVKNKKYRLISSLDPSGATDITVVKVTEDNDYNGKRGALGFKGLSLPDGARLLQSRHQRPSLWLEIVGDSDSAGYGAAGVAGQWACKGGRDVLDGSSSYDTWAGQLSRALGAEMTVQAISGAGVANDEKMGPKVHRTLPFLSSDSWDYAKVGRVPDAVLMLIGPNDETEGKRKAAFKKAYDALMESILAKYTPVAAAAGQNVPQFVHVLAGSGNGLEPKPAIEEVSAAWNKRHPDVRSSVIALDRSDWQRINKKPYLGCDGHYNAKGHEVVADAVEPKLRKLLGSSNNTPVTSPTAAPPSPTAAPPTPKPFDCAAAYPRPEGLSRKKTKKANKQRKKRCKKDKRCSFKKGACNTKSR